MAGARGEIWALGFRNPFTFAFDHPTNRLYINDVGEATWEEIDQGVPGGNFGWPTCEGSCGSPGFQNPIYQYSHSGSSAAITGGAFYRGTQFPSSFVGDYFFADYLRGFIRRLTPANQAIDFRTADSPVDLKVGPDGRLYYLAIFSGAVKRIQHVSSGNQAPTAVLSATPSSGVAPLSVTFSAAGSSDPDGDALVYTWTFGDGTTGNGLTSTHIYAAGGTFTAVLTVDDGRGAQAQASTTITVGTPPVVSITSPPDGWLYAAGDTIAYAGDATTSAGDPLPASAFSWTIVFHHQTHTHPFLGPIVGVKSRTFQIPQVGESDSDVWYEIVLTVTDSLGIQGTKSVNVLPRKAVITLTAGTPGLQLTLDGQPSTTPFSTVSVVGFTRTLGAPSPQTFQGRTYAFSGWSDGGAATHTITTPAANTTCTANYADVTDTTAAPSVGVWHHVAATWNGTTKKLYIDGVQVLSVTAAIRFDTSRVVLGGDYNGGSFVLPFNGFIDEVRLYNRALSLAEIQSDMKTPM